MTTHAKNKSNPNLYCQSIELETKREKKKTNHFFDEIKLFCGEIKKLQGKHIISKNNNSNKRVQ